VLALDARRGWRRLASVRIVARDPLRRPLANEIALEPRRWRRVASVDETMMGRVDRGVEGRRRSGDRLLAGVAQTPAPRVGRVDCRRRRRRRRRSHRPHRCTHRHPARYTDQLRVESSRRYNNAESDRASPDASG